MKMYINFIREYILPDLLKKGLSAFCLTRITVVVINFMEMVSCKT